ncbi:MAG: hypothetical protein KDC66_09570 [Phaeodactylibacter sp.]|nr:hypothetical protein [Phaeodactylibacter sp.]MCB9276908.1 hypothetical protein [Lewinellaceae bacterium]
MMKYYIPILLLFSVLAGACFPILQSRYVTAADIEQLPQNYDNGAERRINGPYSGQWEPYLPDTNHLDHTPMRYIRVNVHWMNTADTLFPFTGKEAEVYTRNLIRAANYDLNKNRKMYLPYRNDTPVFPTGYRYVLTPRPDVPGDDGIYFHFDDELYYYVHRGKNRNLYRRDVFDKYGVQMDTVLNIFIMPHHPDSIASSTYSAFGVGVALSNAVKIAGIYANHNKHDDYWGFRGVWNHEVGHILGLSHAWVKDGCDDTPEHGQECFSNKQPPPCDTATSNNLMDYAAEQNAWSPCQIGRIHQRLSMENSTPRKFLAPNWCTLKDSMEVIIRDTVVWNGDRDLEGHLTIERGGQLTIRCRVSMPPDGAITIAPGGMLVLDGARLHNACGKQWDGIIVQKTGTTAGKLVLIGAPKLEEMRHALE